MDPRFSLITVGGITLIASIALLATHSSVDCVYTPYGGAVTSCEEASITSYCLAPAYYSKQTVQDKTYYTIELYCPWSVNAPTMGYVAFGLAFFGLIAFCFSVYGNAAKFNLLIMTYGLFTTSALAVSFGLLWLDIRLGSALYSDPSKGTYYSHVSFVLTAGLVLLEFVIFTILTVSTYRTCKKEVKVEDGQEASRFNYQR